MLTHFPQNLGELWCRHSYVTGAINSTIIPRNIRVLVLEHTQISSFDGSDFLNLENILMCNNPLKHFIFPPNVKQVDVTSCKLKQLPPLPETLIHLDCSNNKLLTLNNFPDNLTTCNCANNRIFQLPPINHHVRYFWCNNNLLSEFPRFPDTTIMIICNNNLIKRVDHLPKYLQQLKLSGNYIYVIMNDLPCTLTRLYVADNKLKRLPNISACTKLKKIDISKNIFEEVPNFPPNVDVLDISENCIKYVPDHLDYYVNKLIRTNCSSRIVRDDPVVVKKNTYDYFGINSVWNYVDVCDNHQYDDNCIDDDDNPNAWQYVKIMWKREKVMI